MSVGKSLFTQINFLGPYSEVVALDIEAVNPTLARMLSPIPSDPENKYKRFRKRDGSGANLTYIEGDEFATSSWDVLSQLVHGSSSSSGSSPFNVVLSDAMHSPDALVAEVDNILLYRLLNASAFAMLWDDCDGILADTFWNILRPKLLAIYPSMAFHRVSVYGWLGIHEQGGRRHGTCIALNGVVAKRFTEALKLDYSFSKGIDMLAENSN